MNFTKQFFSFIKLLGLLIFGGFYCNDIQAQTKPKTMDDDFYTQSWSKVDSLTQKQLPQSALEVVNSIYTRASKENRNGQLVKAVIHRVKFTAMIDEEAQFKAIQTFEAEAKQATQPTKALLQSMLGQVYWQYYQYNRYKFYNRTATEVAPDDIRTWDLQTLVEATLAQHLAALKEAETLKNVKIDDFQEVINKGDEIGRKRRPTLYDFIAHQAIDFLANNENGIAQPAYQFTLNDARYLMPANEFIKADISTKDSLSFDFYALKTLQDVLKFRLNGDDPELWMDVDLKRLAFVYQNLTATDKEKSYLEALKNLQSKATQYPIWAEITYQIATLIKAQGEKYNPQTSDHQWELKEAYQLCQEIVKKFPQSIGAKQALSLMSQIENKSISLNSQEIFASGVMHPALVQYKNIDKIYWKIISTNQQEKNQITSIADKSRNTNYEQELIKFYNNKTPLRTWESNLPNEGDYQTHSIEEKIPALGFGEYIIMVSDDAQFTYKEHAVTYTFSQVTDITYLQRSNPKDGSLEFYTLHRSTGTPLSGVQAEVLSKFYNYDRGKYETKKLGDFTSNKEGYFSVPYQGDENRRSGSITAIFKQGNDVLNTDRNFSQYMQNASDEYVSQAFFFIDRSIYRPGQTLYFKAIVLEKNGNSSRVLTNMATTVFLYDVNGQKVADLNLTSNEYGSVQGKFTLPNSGLNGQMRLEIISTGSVNEVKHTVRNGENLYKIARQYGITVAQLKVWNNLENENLSLGQELRILSSQGIKNLGSTNFSVEDYKRPKFEVSFEPIKGSYRLGEVIQVEGKAVAYSGANISDAEVSYRVVRQARFPYWWYYRYGYYPTSPQMEITNGKSKTDEAGKFKIDFTALADADISLESSPIFTYTVYADITDINGETHSQQTSVSVAYKAIEISTNISDAWDNTQKAEIKLNSTNLSGEFEPAQGKLTIQRLQSAEKVYRSRNWAMPDKFIYSEQDWHKDLPNDLYKDENNIYAWAVAQEVLSQNFDTGKEKTLTLENIKSWKTGQYKIELTAKDKYGQEVKSVSYFTVFSPQLNQPVIPTLDDYQALKMNGEPGEKAVLKVGSSAKIQALFEVEHEGIIIQKQWIKLDNQTQTLEIPIKEEYRGNFALYYTFIKDNRTYQHSQTVSVPYTNKELDISFETFRDKLQPGEKEKWKINIKGKKGEKVAAEMVATLYDASLDVFRNHSWYFNILNYNSARLSWSMGEGFGNSSYRIYEEGWNKYVSSASVSYDYLNWFGINGYGLYNDSYAGLSRNEAAPVRAQMMKKSENADYEEDGVMEMADGMIDSTVAMDAPPPPAEQKQEKEGGEDPQKVQVRTNFNETAFFLPELRTDKDGNISVEFTIPESLTRWKMLGFAHTQDLKYGMASNTLVTQKDLMVVPNPPRFYRENDRLVFSSKISNISEKDLEGYIQLFMIDPITNQAVDSKLGNTQANQGFKVAAGQSTAVSWELKIPEGMQALTYRVVAKAGKFSDGEEMTLPVLTNRMLVTETLPLPIRGNQTKTFKMEKLLASGSSTTLKNHKFTLEFTSNPAWYAVQALPYMMEYPYECAEQVFSRFYANALGSHIANSSPKIKSVFDAWKEISPDALLSNLDKNQELKSLVLEETPWLMNANNESERKRQLGVLFDLNRMGNELASAVKKLKEKQVSSGAWTWFEGMREDRYLTQHIITGLGHLRNLKIAVVSDNADVNQMMQKGVQFLDREIVKDYQELLKLERQGKIKLADQHIGYYQIQYLYARSYFAEITMDKSLREAIDYYKGQAAKYWTNFNRYAQGMIALGTARLGDDKTPLDIIKSLRERALYSEEMGMYWKTTYGYYWYEAPIETQALMIELFDEIAQDEKAVDDLKTWLLKQKQTQDWKTTKATAEACYALLLRGENWLVTEQQVEITIGDKIINPNSEANVTPIEAGTGYFKTAWNAEEVTANMGNITVKKQTPGVAWGAVYWQYFEQLDKITPAETPLKLKKQLFLQENSDRGPVLKEISEKTPLKVGDLVKVRIELRVDRLMEYVHMKDMRASGFEPVNVISRYKYQDGLGYYESTRDAATNFFFGYLPKGTYVFEYPLRVSQAGDFSNGVTTIQCMYAPEFASHSEGIRVQVK
jgi:uncharacterized protein YfaS (alpha-2-macroglobulin family)